MDTTNELLSESVYSCAVLGKDENFCLIRLDDKPMDEAILSEATRKHFYYCGTLGVTHLGKALVACEPDADAIGTMILASVAFAEQVASLIKAKAAGDSVDWISRLHDLPDTRA